MKTKKIALKKSYKLPTLVLLSVLIGVLIWTFIALFGNFKTGQKPPDQKIPSQNLEKSKVIPSAPTQRKYSKYDIGTSKFTADNTYLIRVRRKPNTDIGQIIDNNKYPADYLTDLLQIPDENKFSNGQIPFKYNSKDERNWSVIKDSSERTKRYTENIFSQDYYTHLATGSLPIGVTFENQVATATVFKAEAETIPFLNDVNFCQKNDDCVIRNNYCSYDSFNWFKDVLAGPYGCGPDYDLALDCIVEIKFQSAKCVNNRCEGTGRTVKCVKE